MADHESTLTLMRAGIPPKYSRSFDDLDRSCNPHAFDACQELAETGTYNGKPGVVLSGEPGNGKTTLAAAALRCYIQRTKGKSPVMFWPVNQALQIAQDSFGTAGSQQLSSLYAYDFMVVDDIGKRRQTDWTQEVLYGVLDSIYNKQHMVIITTNWTADEMFEKLEYSLASRIHEMCHEIILKTHDYRLEC